MFALADSTLWFILLIRCINQEADARTMEFLPAKAYMLFGWVNFQELSRSADALKFKGYLDHIYILFPMRSSLESEIGFEKGLLLIFTSVIDIKRRNSMMSDHGIKFRERLFIHALLNWMSKQKEK
ncbi:hypothetical protein VNO77_18371 [Canavalia gladiata]|uniref:Uncharacterized protein n=1 Tax=Canavalia gladiata TaxID=3824 RepID=A0AAN9LKP2_CANGL